MHVTEKSRLDLVSTYASLAVVLAVVAMALAVIHALTDGSMMSGWAFLSFLAVGLTAEFTWRVLKWTLPGDVLALNVPRRGRPLVTVTHGGAE